MPLNWGGWRSKYPSLAGRITLTKVVLTSLSVYSMATTPIPQAIYRRCTRWIGLKSANSMLGGLGIKSMSAPNLAMLGKLSWRFIREDGDLWIRILKSKHIGPDGKDRANRSHIWKGIRRGAIWTPRNGLVTRFWSDRWLADGRLSEEALIDVSNLEATKIVDYWEEGAGWKWNLLLNPLHNKTLLQQASVLISSDPLVEDDLCRALIPDGNYSKICCSLWRAKVHERAKTFVWLASKWGVLSNSERQMRHFASSATCVMCNLEDETLEHLFRDYAVVHTFWRQCSPTVHDPDFFSHPFSA
ncbi:hypothetical protein V2J09_009812 [Rumex salicifolius]